MFTPTESPMLLLLIGLVSMCAIGIVYMQTRRVLWLYLLAVPILLCGLGVAIDAWIETDREAITAELQAAVDSLRDNDLERTLTFIAEDAEATRQMTIGGLTPHHVSFASIGQVEMEIYDLATPPSAVVSFRGHGSGRLKNDSDFAGMSQPVTVDVRVPYRKIDGRWMIVDGVEFEIVGAGFSGAGQ